MLELFWSNLGNRHCSLCPEGSVHTQQCLKTFPSHLSCSDLTLRTDTALYAKRGLSSYAAVSEDISVTLEPFRSNFENRHSSLCQERAQFVCSSVWRHSRHTWAILIYLREQTKFSKLRQGESEHAVSACRCAHFCVQVIFSFTLFLFTTCALPSLHSLPLPVDHTVEPLAKDYQTIITTDRPCLKRPQHCWTLFSMWQCMFVHILEEVCCWIVPHLPSTTQLAKGLKWSDVCYWTR